MEMRRTTVNQDHKGNRQFVDETADRLPAADSSGGFNGPRFSNASRVHVLDFNQDGAPDFFMGFSSGSNGGKGLSRDMPLVWLNDGTGRFTTLKVGDFVTPGNERLLGTSAHLVATRNGYSFIAPQTNGRALTITGLLATKPWSR